MRHERIRSWVPIIATVMLLGVAGEASANECKESCSEARQTCMKARKIAHKRCATGCQETIQDAVRDARRICVEQELGDAACNNLVRRTVEGAQKACRADCRVDAKLSKTVCRDERRDCRMACTDAVDPECREPCVDDFRACVADQRGCVDVCHGEREAAVSACNDQMGEVCDPEVLRECLQQVRLDTQECVQDCHEETSCGENLRECVGDCADASDEEMDALEIDPLDE